MTKYRVKIDYIGRCKFRLDMIAAFGLVNGEWKVIFPEQVLKDYFGTDNVQEFSLKNKYEMLGLNPDATSRDIRDGFRNKAKIWHPDVSQSKNATEIFQLVNEAYQILSNPKLRDKYNAGLELQKTLSFGYPQDYGIPINQETFHCPLTNGDVSVEGKTRNWKRNFSREYPKKLIVSRIIKWRQIEDRYGRIRITALNVDNLNTVKEIWRNPNVKRINYKGESF